MPRYKDKYAKIYEPSFSSEGKFRDLTSALEQRGENIESDVLYKKVKIANLSPDVYVEVSLKPDTIKGKPVNVLFLEVTYFQENQDLGDLTDLILQGQFLRVPK